MVTSTLLSVLLLSGTAHASITSRGWYPTVKSIEEMGNVADPHLNRDSCGSTRVGDRVLWVCRDTQPYDANGNPTLPVWSSSAAWTNFGFLSTPETSMYATESRSPYFPYASDECPQNSAGGCSDGSRYALWSDSPPVVTKVDSNVTTAYTWIRKTHIRGLEPVNGEKDPATSLYRFVYDTNSQDRNMVPPQKLISETFWPQNGVPFGAYGSVVKDGTAYLFGRPSNGKVCLAKVPTAGVENQSQYRYFVNGAWTASRPDMNSNCDIPNASAGGQGTYYFSYYWKKWVWIGQGGLSVSSYFYVATADNIEGPWEKPVFFYQGHDGTGKLPAYSLQAHPGLSGLGYADGNEIFVSYTKVDGDPAKYSTPLVRIKWN